MGSGYRGSIGGMAFGPADLIRCGLIGVSNRLALVRQGKIARETSFRCNWFANPNYSGKVVSSPARHAGKTLVTNTSPRLCRTPDCYEKVMKE